MGQATSRVDVFKQRSLGVNLYFICFVYCMDFTHYMCFGCRSRTLVKRGKKNNYPKEYELGFAHAH